GPDSAGAMPGPLCYDRGGVEPTITDANVILGYINPGYLVGGSVKLNAARARAVFEERVARPMKLELAHAAYGAHTIAASNMIRAIKAVSTERGRDARAYTLFAFGGNGPLFAAGMAEALGIKRVIVPPCPGLFSSFGLLYADVERHYSRTLRRLLRQADPREIAAAWDELTRAAKTQLAEEGYKGNATRIRRSAALHYQGQTYELNVPVPDRPINGAMLRYLEEAFGREHERTYGYRAGSEEPVELVTIQVVGQGVPARRRRIGKIRISRPEPERPAPRQAYFGPKRGWRKTPVLRRSDLTKAVTGPAIVEEYDATCVIPPGARAKLDEHGNIVIMLAR
ncbi:MAG: hydantoinase/oxoprolinase family protein, partial [Alphaproteobacteria bacterium]|nr:hydantoinase/oxoprolinase family protein [Alphaproteobacteria bacterium]